MAPYTLPTRGPLDRSGRSRPTVRRHCLQTARRSRPPNGVAIDQDGNVVVVNVGDNAVITYDRSGEVIQTEHSVEGGNDGVVVTADGTKYVSSVRYGSVSRIRPGQDAEIVASGIPSAGVHVLRLDSEPTGHSTEQQLRARVCQAQQSGLDCRLGLNHQPIQRDLPVQLRIGGLIGLPHAALADEGGDIVVSEAGTDG